MKKTLVAYFSATGVTASVAKNLAEAAGADLYRIQPEIPYTSDDLNWQNKKCRSSMEMHDRSSRPAVKDTNANAGSYDTIFLGFPIWWYIAPTIINTFLEAYDFCGKTVIVFATSGGSGFGDTVKHLRPSVSSDTRIVEGKILNGRPSASVLREWVTSLALE
jgi:flavodoxin